MLNSEQAKHYGDIAAYGVGAYSTVSFWTDIATTGTVFLTFIGALLSVVWLAWRVLDRWQYGPSHMRGKDDGEG